MKVTPPETDDELFVRLRRGEESAFVALYRRRQGAIYRFVLHMSRSPEVAEDVTQEVFVALLRDACGYDPDRGTLSGYLFGIARKLLLRQIERGRVDVPLESDSEDAAIPELAVAGNALEDLTHREGIEALRRAIGTLPRRYREVVVLCDLEEVDYADAAGVLGCPIGTVRSRLHRARALLLDKLLNHERHPRPPVSALNPIRCLT
jgi:RNA polymerase sigma-70 factor (ECF subfamily)